MKFTSAYEPGEFEAEIYRGWEESNIFAPTPLVNDDSKTFSIVMPPPNANGNLHIGHGLTIALEDSLTRDYRLRGQSSWYIPGADHAGFETWVVYERALEKEGKTRFMYSREELYSQVWNFVQEQRGNMELQVRALGASCSWKDLTFTLDENVVRRVYSTFERMWKDGMIYRGEKLVNYCPKHQTAFADIEVEHVDENGKLWDIAYQVADGEGEIVVSTTRPETLFGDTAVAVNPEDARYKNLIGRKVKLPLTEREIVVVADEHADPEYGTGAVKITPAHDYDDFEVGVRHGLERVRVIDDAGRMMNCGENYDGLTTEECRKKVLKDLKEADLLRGEKKIVHSVAHCYKCGTVIEPTLKDQWFIDVKRLAKEAIKHLRQGEIKFHPASKQQVLINYLEGLKDWNISRQIPWGIAIPMFRRADLVEGHEKNVDYEGDGVMDVATSALEVDGQEAPEWVFDTRTNLQEIEIRGVRYIRDEDTFDTWFSSGHWPIVCTNWESGDSPVNKASSSASADVVLSRRTLSTAPSASPASLNLTPSRQENGAPSSSHLTTPVANPASLNLTSSRQENGAPFSSHLAASEANPNSVSGAKRDRNPYYPLNVMETGADILFAWVARMIMIGIYVTGEVPFREVYLHGLVLDEHGQKMSKSKGNVINPMELVAKYGSDAFRLGILRGRSAGMNQAFAENSVVAGRNLCNKLWNVARLVQSIVDDSPAGSEVEGWVTTENMGEDWICREINQARESLERQMEEYRFSEAVETLHSLVWDKYADWFIESQKLYHNVNLLKATLEAILKMLHPFAPFVTEAIWQNLSWTEGMLIVSEWPSEFEYDPISAENFAKLTEVVAEIRSTMTAISKLKKAKGKYDLLYGDDSLVADNDTLVKNLARVPDVKSCEGQPRGIRLALANHELYLDVPAEVVSEYAEALDERILAVGRELDALNMRMMNPRYVDKAPAKLVEETRRAIEEKSALIERLKQERQVI